MFRIFNLSWKEDSFLAKLLLFQIANWQFLKVTSRVTDDWRAGYIKLASTHYSIAGTGAAKLRRALQPHILMPFRLLFWIVTWLPLTALCYWRTLPLVRKAEKFGGWEAMTANQISVCQSILRQRGEYLEAERCILAAFDGVKEIPPHTEGLLLVGLIDCHLHSTKDLAEIFVPDNLRKAITLAEEVRTKDPFQASRIFRQCADLLGLAEKKGFNLSAEVSLTAKELSAQARELAEECGAKDQLVKLT